MPLRDFQCLKCNQFYESLYRSGEEFPPCPHCGPGTGIQIQLSAPGGYQMNSGTGSTRPKHSGSFKRPKNVQSS